MKKFLLVCFLMINLLLNGITVYAEDPRPDYLIMVNRAANCVTVYQRSESGEFTIPVIAFSCSTGKNNKTRTGHFKIANMYRWRKMDGGVYTQYAVRFDGSRLFHSVPYYRQKSNQLEWEHYNRLGEQASAGCVRLSCADSKWIYDHCKIGTEVVVYDDAENPGPLGKPATIQIAPDQPNRGWDPTDPSPDNPWITILPLLRPVDPVLEDNILSLPVGSDPEALRSSIAMFSADGSAYLPDSYHLEIYGYYDLGKAGSYELYVRGFDQMAGLRADQTFTLMVNEMPNNAVAPTDTAQDPSNITGQ